MILKRRRPDSGAVLLSVTYLACFVDLLTRYSNLFVPGQLFCLGTIGVASPLDFPAPLRRVILIGQPTLSGSLDFKRVGLGAMRGVVP